MEGDWPGPNEVVIDEDTADKKDFEIGDTIGVQAEGPVERLRIAGLVRFGDTSIGGATLAGFDLPTAQRLFEKEGELDEIAVAAEPDVDPQQLIANLERRAAAEHAGAHRRPLRRARTRRTRTSSSPSCRASCSPSRASRCSSGAS